MDVKSRGEAQHKFNAYRAVAASVELSLQNREKTKLAAELVIANGEKADRAAELVIANGEKADRAAELETVLLAKYSAQKSLSSWVEILGMS